MFGDETEAFVEVVKARFTVCEGRAGKELALIFNRVFCPQIRHVRPQAQSESSADGDEVCMYRRDIRLVLFRAPVERGDTLAEANIHAKAKVSAHLSASIRWMFGRKARSDSARIVSSDP